MRTILISSFLFLTVVLYAQPVLKPGIGIGALPSDADSICYAPWYLGSFYTSGLQAGDTAADFTLYDLNGDSLNLRDALGHGRPVLLVAGSYTCPVFRSKVDVINDVVAMYGGQLDVYVIYTIEAHPDSDTSVYFGYVNPTTQNIQQGVLYRQPLNYGERKQIVTDMLSSMSISARVFIDGPCNNWWSFYGPAPNNAYLLDTDGIVYSKHGWFDRFPDNIYCAIDSLLGTSSGNCTAHGGNSTYTFQYLSSDTVYGPEGSTISVDAQLTNTGTDDILIHAQRIENQLPPGWATSMCIDVCYSTSTDSVVFLLPAGSIQPVHVYFYTTMDTGTGHVKLGFKNLDIITNNNFMHAFGITSSPTGILNATGSEAFSISPNPAYNKLCVYSGSSLNSVVEIFSIMGKRMLHSENQPVIDISEFPGGIYFVKTPAGVSKFIKE